MATRYIPALRFGTLTRFYDGVIGVVTREARWRGALLDAAALAPGQRVLDVGCGTGSLLLAADRRVPYLHLWGIDVDPAMLQQARRKATRAGAAMDLQVASATRLPYPHQTFDCVMSSLCLHHLTTRDKFRTLREIARVAKPGGCVLIADWGVPLNRLQRALYVSVQLLDGFATTAANARGLIPELMRHAGLIQVRTAVQLPTAIGTLAIYSATVGHGEPV